MFVVKSLIQCWEYKYCTTRPYMILHYKINEGYTRYITYSTLQDTYGILHYAIHTWYWTVQIRTLYWTVRSIGAWIGLWRREENAFEMAKEFAFWFLVAFCGFFSWADVVEREIGDTLSRLRRFPGCAHKRKRKVYHPSSHETDGHVLSSTSELCSKSGGLLHAQMGINWAITCKGSCTSYHEGIVAFLQKFILSFPLSIMNL